VIGGRRSFNIGEMYVCHHIDSHRPESGLRVNVNDSAVSSDMFDGGDVSGEAFGEGKAAIVNLDLGRR
jgi:hypothetical protein